MRNLGYKTILAGKMHFVGPDQLHGFEQRLTTDIYPSDFGWVPNWETPEKRPEWYHNMLSVVQAGKCITTNQMDFDEEVTFLSKRSLLDLSRPSTDQRPFFMVVSLTHPHDPYAISAPFYDLYSHDEIDMPQNPTVPDEDPHSKRLKFVIAEPEYQLTPDRIKTARHAYYGSCSYVDDKVGQLLSVLDSTGLRQNTIIVFGSDHGDMLGERGLWYKMNFFEMSARIPLIFSGPNITPRRVSTHVSLLDLLPTFVSLATGQENYEYSTVVEGRSLYSLLRGEDGKVPNEVFAEYLGEGAISPLIMIRRGKWKYVYCKEDPDQLYDLEEDKWELRNIAGKEENRQLVEEFRREVLAKRDVEKIRKQVIESQKNRRLVNEAMNLGKRAHWDWQPVTDATRQYVRSHMDLDDIERMARYPTVPIPAPDGDKNFRAYQTGSHETSSVTPLSS
eukprot:TRINITY_DN2823_c0_g1_i3.p1 TRINITY_DN2823_c0_g1~~TRINITY_DN2823_c0_g1_i3.p1  ORF type:complete len:447 (+),score=94.52 TRINITY_DN2823_c0_g1_i3:482-1822(+)